MPASSLPAFHSLAARCRLAGILMMARSWPLFRPTRWHGDRRFLVPNPRRRHLICIIGDAMREPGAWLLICTILALRSVDLVRAEDDYKIYSLNVTYGMRSSLGFLKQVILINNQFPGPSFDVVTNDNIILNLFNNLDEPFLLTWNGIKQRKNSWQDGVLGTNCPIPPGSHYTYRFQTKDQIGSYAYFPSTQMHKSAGGFGSLNVHQRSVIPIPYGQPDGDFTLLICDWYKDDHKTILRSINSGGSPGSPVGVLINGLSETSFTGDPGKTYMFRVSNVGLEASISFEIQNHKLTLVEVEGSHTIQNPYDFLDVHVGQSMTVLVTLNQPSKDYYIVISTPFMPNVLTTTSVLHYSNSRVNASGPLPINRNCISDRLGCSIGQANSIRWNLSANAARPNPQGSFHYGKVTITRTIVLTNSAPLINNMQRFAINGISFENGETPVKLADYFNILGVFRTDLIQNHTNRDPAIIATTVEKASLHEFIEVVFQNNEETLQSYHLSGYDFWVVGFETGQWSLVSKAHYNLHDAVARHTAQVFPHSWTAILVSLDNEGMWNLRSAAWPRQYLGQQFYLKVYSPVRSGTQEYDLPTNALLCGKAAGKRP